MKLDLTDAELDELDDLLARTPQPLQPMDAVMLDGYLCGLIVQPQMLAVDDWLPPVLDVQGGTLPDGADARWLERLRALLMRRHEALSRSLEEDGAFMPVLPGDTSELDDAAMRDALRELPAHSHTLMPWALGFQFACARFPALMQLDDPEVDAALARVMRHVPTGDPDGRVVQRRVEQMLPLADEEAAVDDLVLAVAELWALTRERRMSVRTVRRTEPKVGRNVPCPCGSGRKFKHCHGAAGA